MKVSVAINNYNYSEYIVECIESVLNQTYKNIEVIIIDDGSTDNSLNIITSHYSENPLIKIVSKINAGQLSAFNEAVKYITGDIVFFLDSDDLYKKDYIENTINVYKQNEDIDFVFCALEKFYNDGKREFIHRYEKSQNLGYSILSCLYFRKGLGGETSTISMKRSLVDNILPLSLEADWITRADECLNWASSIFGAKKYYLNEALIEYRVHGSNAYCGNNFKTNYLYIYQRINIENRFFKHIFKKYGINENISLGSSITTDIVKLSLLEYKSIQIKTFKMFKLYAKIILNSNINILKKAQNLKHLFFLYLNFR